MCQCCVSKEVIKFQVKFAYHLNQSCMRQSETIQGQASTHVACVDFFCGKDSIAPLKGLRLE